MLTLSDVEKLAPAFSVDGTVVTCQLIQNEKKARAHCPSLIPATMAAY